MFNYVAIKHKQMSFVSNGGKFKLYTVIDGLIFPTPTQPRISFERAIFTVHIQVYRYQFPYSFNIRSNFTTFVIKNIGWVFRT
jgi:hypothetical protein